MLSSSNSSSRVSFNSRTPGGVRPATSCLSPIGVSFNSRTPGGVRQNSVKISSMSKKFQFTHPGRGATLRASGVLLLTRVSIHAPREGCDSIYPRLLRLRRQVSIHAPREGCDEVAPQRCLHLLRFNSRTPGGVRLTGVVPSELFGTVSIHAPREGCDCESDYPPLGLFPFQFTHPGRGATSSSS